MKSKALKVGYIILCVAVILNFIYDNIFVISFTHIGVNSSGLLGDISDFLMDISLNSGGLGLVLFHISTLIVSIIISAVGFAFYRKRLPKATAVVLCTHFIPYAVIYLLMYMPAMIYVCVGIAKEIYLIVTIVLMLKDIRYICEN